MNNPGATWHPAPVAGIQGGLQGGGFQGTNPNWGANIGNSINRYNGNNGRAGFNQAFANPGQNGLQVQDQQNIFQNGNNDNRFDNNKLSYEELQQRRQQQAQVREKAKSLGSALAAIDLKQGVTSVASAEEVGDYFQYVIDHKVTLPRQKSALLPIVNDPVEAARVSIYNESVQSKFPLLGLCASRTPPART